MGAKIQMSGLSVATSMLLGRYAPAYYFGLFSTTAAIFSVQLALYLTWLVVIYPRFWSPLRFLPTPPDGGFFLGQTQRIRREPTAKPLQDWLENVPNDGLIKYSVWFQERLLLTNPKTLGEVLVTNSYQFIKPSRLREALGRILGVGILLAEGDEHKTQRKNLMPAFAYRHVKDIVPIFWTKSRELAECLSKASKSSEPPSEQDSKHPKKAAVVHAAGSIEVGNWTSRATLDIIGTTGVGAEFNALQNESGKLNQTYRTIFKPDRTRLFLQVLTLFLPFWVIRNIPLQRNFQLNGASDYIKEVCRDLIKQKRQTMTEKDRTDVDIISVALESGGFTDEELVNQMMTFLVAGHETTSTAMIWAMYLMCKHKDVQEKLRKEVRAKLPSLSDDITASELDSCHYLHAVCSEVLRIWSPVSLTLRVADKDTSINGQFVPKGTTIIIAPWAVNTCTHLWGADAHEFRPERWLDADGKANHNGGASSNFSFLTFLHGPRGCIGQKFAQAEFAALLGSWIGRFDASFEEGSPFATVDFPEIQGGITSKPKGGLWVTLNEVEGW